MRRNTPSKLVAVQAAELDPTQHQKGPTVSDNVHRQN